MVLKALLYAVALLMTMLKTGIVPDVPRFSVLEDIRDGRPAADRRYGIDIDDFYMSVDDADARIMFAELEVYDLLTRSVGDPLNPERRGAVLTKLNAVSYAVLPPETSTSPASLEKRQHIYYFVSGKGELTVGGDSVDIHNGIGLLVPPGIEYMISNTGQSPLVMYIIDEPVENGVPTRGQIVVKNEYNNPISSNYRRTPGQYWLFNPADGLTELTAVNTMMFEPHSAVPPHVHEEGVEEIWLGIDGEMYFQIGLQRRKLTPGTAYKAPADGKTPHTNINVASSSRKVMWLMAVPRVGGQPQAPDPDGT